MNRQKKILLVDDEKLVKEMIEARLKQWGYEYASFSDAESALLYFKDHSDDFDLAITDFTMPPMPGNEMARRMRMIVPQLPIILITGALDITGIGHDVSTILQKPILAKDLLEAITHLIGKENN